MSSNNNTQGAPPGPGGAPFDPLNQVIFILGPDGTTKIPLTPAIISSFYADASSLSILYGTQIGACFMMLAVLLAMTPRVRFRRAPTIISILALTLNMIRMVLLAIFFPSAWLNFYALFTMDYSFVPRADYVTFVAATALSIPITMLIMAALVVQAWSMIQLWQPVYKWSAAILSLALVFLTIGFNFAGSVIQAKSILDASSPIAYIWVRKTYLALITTSICWFCFLFNVRLVMHMWSNRSILPSLKGLKAMDVLVITNGILMFVPVIFAGLEWAQFTNFESASLTQTSVIVALPLGTLVAQRLAAPTWFGSNQPSGISPSHAAGFNPAGSTNGTGRPLLVSSGSAHRQAQHVGVTSRVVAEPYRRESEMTEKGVRVHHREGGHGLESGVRIERRVEVHEERAGGATSTGSASPTMSTGP